MERMERVDREQRKDVGSVCGAICIRSQIGLKGSVY